MVRASSTGVGFNKAFVIKRECLFEQVRAYRSQTMRKGFISLGEWHEIFESD
ncbi:hypothetical protein KATP_45800 (plasmid) [Kluyvera ascorbata]|nr:hypothetical protein KATP_45800 [Kluyvera ascorbata]